MITHYSILKEEEEQSRSYAIDETNTEKLQSVNEPKHSHRKMFGGGGWSFLVGGKKTFYFRATDSYCIFICFTGLVKKEKND